MAWREFDRKAAKHFFNDLSEGVASRGRVSFYISHLSHHPYAKPQIISAKRPIKL